MLNQYSKYIIFFCIAVSIASCQESTEIYFHSRVFQFGDNEEWALSEYDDSNWSPFAWSNEMGIYWIRFKIDLNERIDQIQYPGIHMISIGSYEAYWDGQLIYENGKVGQNKSTEIPGRFISQIPLPDSLLEYGEHTLALRVSNYHNTIFRGSWNTFFIEEYGHTKSSTLTLTALMFIIAGMFLIASIYYFLLYLNQRRNPVRLLFSLMCLFFFGLIFMEFYKFIIPYPYYFHYYRLGIIGLLTIATSFLVPFFLYTLFDFPKRKIFGIIYLMILVGISVWNGIINDRTTWLLSAIMLIVAIIVSSIALIHRKSGSRIMLLVLMAIAIINYYVSFQVNNLIFNYDINLFLSFIALVLSILYLMAQKSKEQEEAYESSLLRSARLQNELLKKNIRPHFIMNTLTSIMEWVEISPKKSIEFIEALADEFDILNNIADLKLIPIRQEIDLCKRHLEIMGYRKEINFIWRDNNIDNQETIPPAILHTIVENGITHNKPVDGQIRFHLEFDRIDEWKVYTLQTFGINRMKTKITEGTGLKYIKSRLNESYGDHWNLISTAMDQGWETRIEIKQQ